MLAMTDEGYYMFVNAESIYLIIYLFTVIPLTIVYNSNVLLLLDYGLIKLVELNVVGYIEAMNEMDENNEDVDENNDEDIDENDHDDHDIEENDNDDHDIVENDHDDHDIDNEVIDFEDEIDRDLNMEYSQVLNDSGFRDESNCRFRLLKTAKQNGYNQF